ncbi:MAG: CBS domain-containing protein [Ignavibacteriaceae bacterium]|nr:CBS domain-containing protein [Ignavibacterium sp.]MCC6253325.1 CBS domain-containing protein [Ignavibacteriaceae bacterium]HMN24645.1 CBS domain-containing protein [Ignavibacteriaceae bacterium]HRN27375.1 CBS domain-containing protein [Ignavibacteriaceae bacterium]HRQ55064.1 CBS domain-containing protein [Ignavibacteriaceae bacterium]
MESIKDMLNGREVFTVQSGSTIKETVNYMASKKVGLVPVLDSERLLGVFSERDLVKRVIAEEKDLITTTVDDVMSTSLVIAKIDESTESILAKMKEAKTRHILVIDDEKLVGVLSIRDLLEIDLNHCKTTVEVLNNYIYSK